MTTLSKNLMGCHEVTLSYKRKLFDEMIHIKNSSDADLILKKYIDLDQISLKEFFWVILLTNANRVIGISQIGEGTIKGVAVNFHSITQLAVLTNSSAIIVAHNHPSGTLKPSQTDINVTSKLQKITDPFDIDLLDHLIITAESYYSFSDQHML